MKFCTSTPDRWQISYYRLQVPLCSHIIYKHIICACYTLLFFSCLFKNIFYYADLSALFRIPNILCNFCLLTRPKLYHQQISSYFDIFHIYLYSHLLNLALKNFFPYFENNFIEIECSCVVSLLICTLLILLK